MFLWLLITGFVSGKSMILEGVYFKEGRVVPTVESRAFLDSVVVFLKTHKDAVIEIIGRTDSRGGKDLNKRVSEKRAEAVKKLFVEYGIEESRIKTRGAGCTLPTIPEEKTEDDRRINRQALIVIYYREEAGKVVIALGKVFVKRKTVKVLKAGERVFLEDTISTSFGGYVKILLNTGDYIDLMENTTISLKEVTEEKSIIHQFIGKVKAVIRKLKGERLFEIKNPIAAAGVRGTEFAIVVDTTDGFSSLSTQEGKVQFSSGGGYVMVEKGMGSYALKGMPPAPPSPLLPSPEVIHPREDGELPSSHPKEVYVEWEPVEGAAGYYLLVSRDSLFTDVVYSHQIKGTRVYPDLQPGTYYLKVSTIGEYALEGIPGAPIRFRVK